MAAAFKPSFLVFGIVEAAYVLSTFIPDIIINSVLLGLSSPRQYLP